MLSLEVLAAKFRRNTAEELTQADKRRLTLIQKYGSEVAYYEAMRKAGAKGGKAKTSATKKRGFGGNPELASKAGKLGGAKSRKGRK